MTPQRPFVVIDDSLGGRTTLYEGARDLIVANEPEEIGDAFSRMEAARKTGLTLAGFASYELGYLLEPRLVSLLPGKRQLPLLAFGAFAEGKRVDRWPEHAEGHIGELAPAWSSQDYGTRFSRVLNYIAAGDVYQINLTFPLASSHSGDLLGLYGTLRKRQPVSHGAIVALGAETILSFSPELFFAVVDGRITARPMKGTARRGRDEAGDRAAALALAVDEKQRAENLMIVDLLRNDLSRIGRIGSVHVPRLFQIETYPTLHQMTSTVTGELSDGLTLYDLFAALFPCGSVTGAPKIRAMEIIRELEATPRGVYCGAVGWIAPSGAMSFNVAIRTLTCFSDGTAIFNVGSGIVADSTAASEYEECLLKSRFLHTTPARPP